MGKPDHSPPRAPDQKITAEHCINVVHDDWGWSREWSKLNDFGNLYTYHSFTAGRIEGMVVCDVEDAANMDDRTRLEQEQI